ncbi:hypothetical protein [Gaoshiqia sediminis]|uniref:Uncharacterized protein n=1 Tax=Gaoshiqia sediminis TaxID=2986998 RepID=A0AA41YAE6_9BACT|nr:hypothetical protein [Gaoshiqia sediminis]MCW0484965.1 hypothetical protein [Gaoshiqia sediminis]
MSTKVILEFDGRNAAARSIVNMLKTVGLFKVEEQKPISGIEKSLKEVKEGKVHKYNNVDELFEKID